ncbi:hypothetical protein F5148DRAFT_1199426 [Russula earlei]|uniref:Uncharacterized protein n=1 Tax=Russula earlei TaxID=71964 RepID=A0ACC0UAG9_9AGAM|nr:hypothetical protein F5148DRAFT_1199426 [Russula earlei]
MFLSLPYLLQIMVLAGVTPYLPTTTGQSRGLCDLLMKGNPHTWCMNACSYRHAKPPASMVLKSNRTQMGGKK